MSVMILWLYIYIYVVLLADGNTVSGAEELVEAKPVVPCRRRLGARVMAVDRRLLAHPHRCRHCPRPRAPQSGLVEDLVLITLGPASSCRQPTIEDALIVVVLSVEAFSHSVSDSR